MHLKGSIHTLVLVFIFACLSQGLLAMKAAAEISRFKDKNQAYLEVFIQVQSDGLEKISVDSLHFQSAVNVTLIIKESSEIVQVDKFKLLSPIATQIPNFIDIKRYALPEGRYEVEITLADDLKPQNDFYIKKRVKLDFPMEFAQSDILFLNSYKTDTSHNPMAKNGVLLDCKTEAYLKAEEDFLMFYQEVYGSDKAIGEDFLIRYMIEHIGLNKQSTPLLESYHRQKSHEIIVLLNKLNVSTLDEGRFNFVVEIMDRNKHLLSRTTKEFRKEGKSIEPYLSTMEAEELNYALRAVAIIANDYKGDSINALVDHGAAEEIRSFLAGYWNALSPRAPKRSFKSYMHVASAVDRTYQSGFGFGFESDRGATYLKYGPPDNVISEEQDPVAPPYEIWTYYDFPKTNQTNVKFIFYNPDLAGKNYQVLHSTARGEYNNPRWQFDLYGRDLEDRGSRGFLDGTEVRDGYNRNASRYFRDH